MTKLHALRCCVAIPTNAADELQGGVYLIHCSVPVVGPNRGCSTATRPGIDITLQVGNVDVTR